MFVDASIFPAGHVERARICIFGSGPAGMTLALSLAESGIDVLLVEGGGLEFDAESQALYQGTVVGDLYFGLDETRLRYFGGTSGHWGGACRPLDPQDFVARPGRPETGWPIGAEDLVPYLAGACEILEISTQFDDPAFAPGLVWQDFHFSPPVRFGDKYLSYCETAPNLRVCPSSSLVNMLPRNTGPAAIGTAEVVTEPGEVSEGDHVAWKVEAEIFVLCLGGIENSRTLAWINQQNGRRLIREHDLIGRYWMEHPATWIGEAILFDNAREILDQIAFLGPDWRDQGMELYLGLTAGKQDENALLNVRFLFLEQAYASTKQLVSELLCLAPTLGYKLASAFDRNLICGGRLEAMWEQTPDPANRVALGEKRDRLGIPQVELHWRVTDTDRKSIAASSLEFARLFAEHDLGRVRLVDWIDDETIPMPQNLRHPAHHHHMGGTRMSASPETGVVDADLRVHDLDNLYVGGSSVFPTSGYANPTLTIVQLSLRLADHLRTRLAV
jgi:hypothetical protein